MRLNCKNRPKKFLTQLFVLLEDLRVEEIVKNLRPGTKHVLKEEKKCIAITLAHKMKSIAFVTITVIVYFAYAIFH